MTTTAGFLTAQAGPIGGEATTLDLFVRHLLSGVVFAVIGLAVFAFALWLIVKVTPFSVRKEIEEDQNVALGVIVGSVMIGVSLIIAAAIQG